MDTAVKSRGYVSATLGCRCPRCREGKLFANPLSFRFKKNMEMNKRCPVCGQPTEIEVGFYYGTGYVSYALAIGVTVASFAAWFLTVGMSLDDNRFFFWLGFNALLLVALQPWLMRVSRSFWISWFVRHDAHWKEHPLTDFSERANAEHANNW